MALIMPRFRLHHTNLPKYMRDMKKYHLAHHYKNFDLGFGVTSTFALDLILAFVFTLESLGKIWDIVFKTVLPVN